jgi:redox-sensitive bicupin YhaK (pirin superfamily)
LHSEYNLGTELLRFLQIWILPDKKGYEPNYGEYRFNIEDRRDKWLPLVAGVENQTSSAPVRVHQDINVYAAIISAGKSLDLAVAEDRQAYLVLIEGSAKLTAGSGQAAKLVMRDAAEITGEDVTVCADGESHVLVLEMARG